MLHVCKGCFRYFETSGTLSCDFCSGECGASWNTKNSLDQEHVVRVHATAGGTKNDAEKIPLELLSTIWLNGVGQVLGFGKRKYAAHNWRKGISQSRLMGAALRHILAFNDGEDNDPESGLSHLFHASCCIMFASELLTTRPDLDDRYRGTNEKDS